MQAPKADKNMPLAAGQKASKTVMFGKFNRYAVYAVHTRFDAVQWFVNDAEKKDRRNFSTTIRIENSFEEAVKGLI